MMKHGHAANHKPSRTYKTWQDIKARCSPVYKQHKDYFDRGIRVCDRWLGKDGFLHFLQDMGDKPGGLTIDRRDNDLGYEPDNCRWVTWTINRNNRRYDPQSIKTRCPKGHPYSGSNVGWRRGDRSNERYCRQCQRDWKRNHDEQRRLSKVITQIPIA